MLEYGDARLRDALVPELLLLLHQADRHLGLLQEQLCLSELRRSKVVHAEHVDARVLLRLLVQVDVEDGALVREPLATSWRLA